MNEQVKVVLTEKSTPAGLHRLVDTWEQLFPDGKIQCICGYVGTTELTLNMPPATTIVVPQLVDATGVVE